MLTRRVVKVFGKADSLASQNKPSTSSHCGTKPLMYLLINVILLSLANRFSDLRRLFFLCEVYMGKYQKVMSVFDVIEAGRKRRPVVWLLKTQIRVPLAWVLGMTINQSSLNKRSSSQVDATC